MNLDFWCKGVLNPKLVTVNLTEILKRGRCESFLCKFIQVIWSN